MGVERQFAGDYFLDVTLGLGLNPPRRYVMSVNTLQRSALLAKFKEHVALARYGSSTVGAYVAVADHFLEYLSRRKVPIQKVCSEHVSAFLGCELLQFSRRHGAAPASVGDWRTQHSSGIRQLLCWVNGRLPATAAPRCPFEAFSRTLCDEYAQWLDGQRGLATASIDGLVGEARRFLVWYGKGKTSDGLSAMAIADIDAYLQARAISLRRVSLKGVTHQRECSKAGGIQAATRWSSSRNRATLSGIGSSDCVLHSRSFAVRSPLITAQRTWARRWAPRGRPPAEILARPMDTPNF